MRPEILGYILLGSVVVIWVSSGFFIQYLFKQSEFDHPVTMTVMSIGLCSLLLLLPSSSPDPLSDRKASLVSRKKSTLIYMWWLGLIWLAAQLLYNVSLRYMSVSSNTAIASSSSLFTFLFSVKFLRGYSFTPTAVAALACSCAGILLLSSLENTNAKNNSSFIGFGMALISCACYGLFTTLLKRFTLSSPVPVTTMFGYFGVVAILVGTPLIMLSDYTGFDAFALPRTTVAIFGIVANAIIGSVLSDILLAKAVILLNPVTVSIGLSMSMPLSLLMDSVVVHSSCVLAILLQFTAVCLISIDNHRQGRI